MSQESRENFGVKTQISIGGWRGRGRGREGGEKKEILEWLSTDNLSSPLFA